ncbi:hypothetical protein DFH07DRAFT_781672 [Mycena maculata]|uniref:Uncharacterized protein n=1 Tax=Mycena maculata TaxID=230809 RepID=A0AAD7MRR6_9AGAR|nr:hypothetical protein DFH07DRAFT_781672 [Mycena maculata]
MSSPPVRSSPERIRVLGDTGGALNRVPEGEELPESEDVDWELEEELVLEEQGFYRGSYKRIIALYSLAPLTALVFLVLLAVLPYIAYRSPNPQPRTYPYSTLLPFPLPEILAATALYSLTHLLRGPIYTVSAVLVPFPLPATLLSTTLHTLLSTAARLSTLALLQVRHHALYPYPTWHDPAFFRVWWAALGWAAADAVASVHQGYAGLALYRPVLVPPSAPPSDPERTPLLPPRPAAPDPDAEIDSDIDQLVALKAREELEDVFGLPLIHIPAFIPCLQRTNALLLSLGLFLLLGAALYRARPLPLVALAAATHLLLAVLHASFVLPRVGVQNAAYVGAIVSLGALFAGLGVWDGISPAVRRPGMHRVEDGDDTSTSEPGVEDRGGVKAVQCRHDAPSLGSGFDSGPCLNRHLEFQRFSAANSQVEFSETSPGERFKFVPDTDLFRVMLPVDITWGRVAHIYSIPSWSRIWNTSQVLAALERDRAQVGTFALLSMRYCLEPPSRLTDHFRCYRATFPMTIHVQHRLVRIPNRYSLVQLRVPLRYRHSARFKPTPLRHGADNRHRPVPTPAARNRVPNPVPTAASSPSPPSRPSTSRSPPCCRPVAAPRGESAGCEKTATWRS